MEDRILRLHPVIKELVADMEKQKKIWNTTKER